MKFSRKKSKVRKSQTLETKNVPTFLNNFNGNNETIQVTPQSKISKTLNENQ